jgi:acetyl-CoA C-acetyltransferase
MADGRSLPGIASRYEGVWLVDGVRTGFGELSGALRENSATDLGIAAARRLFDHAGVAPQAVDVVIGASLAHTDFDSYYLPRHIGLYAGVGKEVPAIFVHRLCGSGFETLAQAADYLTLGKATVALCVGAESMSRNPVASFTGRSGFRMGQAGFRDFLWEALTDPTPGIAMAHTAENLAQRYQIPRAEVDAYALRSFTSAAAAERDGFFADEIVPVRNERFELDGYRPRTFRLPKGISEFRRDEHARPTTAEALAKLPPVFGGVQTAGNSSGIVDGAAAALVAGDAFVEADGRAPLARIVAAAAVGVPPEIMGIGPAPAIRKLLAVAGLDLGAIDRFEINEAFGAQYLAVEKELGLDRDKVNVNGGAIAIGHPLAATGLRCTITLARELKRRGLRFGIASACCGGGQGSALLIENPEAGVVG